MDHFVESNHILLRYLDHPGDGPPIVLLPGLTGNAHVFGGLIQAGLSPRFRVLALDLRGRGLSDKPAQGYSLAEHARDVIGLLDVLNIESTVIGGHSFGALLALYIGARYPQRVERCIFIDADTTSAVHPQTRELIRPALDRLGRVMPSWHAYLEAMRELYYGWWDPAIEAYYRADVETLAGGGVRSRVRPEAIAETLEHVVGEDWSTHLQALHRPSILFNAPEPAGAPGTPPVIPPHNAQAMARLLPDCQYVTVPGNHMTMLFGEGAQHIVGGIKAFLT